MFRKLWLLCVAVALAAPALAGPAKKKRVKGRRRQPSVAVWNIRELGVDPQMARKVHYDLVQAFSRMSGFRLVPDRTVEKRIKKGRVKADTPAPRVAKALKASYILTGTLGGLGEEVSLDLKVLHGRTGQELRRVAVSVPMEIQARRVVLDELLVRLLNPARWTGSLWLDVSVDGAQVHLDGNQVASTPLEAPLTGLAPGKHILRITKEGFGEFSKFVVIRYNQTARLNVDLNNAMVVGLIYEQGKPKPKAEPKPDPVPSPREPEVIVKEVSAAPSRFQTVMAWTLLGLGAGLTAAGVVTMVMNDPHPNDSRTLTVLTPICYTVGGLSLVGALVLFLIGGDSAAPQEDQASGVSLHPVLTGNGLGVGLGGRF